MLLFAICFTVLMFLGSLILLIVASILYIPFLCYMQGNLKVSCVPADLRVVQSRIPADCRNSCVTRSTRCERSSTRETILTKSVSPS